MTIIELLTSAWAIDPAKLLEIQDIYAAHLKGPKLDLDAIEARMGRPLANEQQEYRVEQGGIAVLSVQGVIAPKANIFTRVSGGASAQMLTKQIESMRADPRVRGAVFDFDTPGGSVFGIPAMGEAIRALSAEKPTASVSTGMMASAGYWTGSAANSVYASGSTDIIGSIGVVMTHQYNPRGTGVQTTELTAGKYKRIASDNEPLSKEGKAYLQSQVDHLYQVFVDTVAQNRKVSAEQVLERMADGRTFIGQQAMDAGLIDGFASVDDLVERMATDPQKFAARRKAVFALGAPSAAAGAVAAEDVPATSDEPVPPVESATHPESTDMKPEDLAAFVAANPEAVESIRAEGAAAERARIAAVREQSMPGHEKLIEALAADGKTTGPEAAVQVLAAERARIAGAAAARAADAPKVVPTEASESADDATSAKPAARAPNIAAVYGKLNRS